MLALPTSPSVEQRDDRGPDLRVEARPRVEELLELGLLGYTLADLRTKTLVRAGMEVNARAKPRAKPKRCRRGDSRARMKRTPIILGTPADRGRSPSAINESGGAHCGCRLSGEPVG